MPPVLELKRASVTYGSAPALSDVDLVVPHGAVVGVLGPNGAGKSTMLNAIAGLVPLSSGGIGHRGERIDKLTAHDRARRGICLIPEGRGILPRLTVAENLKVALGNAPLDGVFERFDVLEQRLEQAAGTLSGGEQQMLAMARALAPSVDVLLVDEPSLGLAPRMVDMVERTLRTLHEGGQTIVWVEQYASRVLALADVVYILGRGRIAWCGEPSELHASKVLTKTYLGGAT